MIDKETGLVARANDIESFFGAVQYLIEHPEECSEMAKAARHYMEERSFESAFDGTWRIYHQEPLVQEPQFARAV